MKRLAVMLALVTIAVAVVGTTRGVERERYVAANEALRAELPSYPRAVRMSVRSSAYYDGDAAWSPVAGYTTLAFFRLPPDTYPSRIAVFYERKLAPEWTLTERIDEPPSPAGPILNFRRGRAGISVNLESWRGGVLEIAVDSGGE